MNETLDVLLINPPYANQSYALNIPLGLCYIASVLEKEGYKVKVLDLQTEKIDLKKTIDYFRPWVAGISGTTQIRFESFPRPLGQSKYTSLSVSPKSRHPA